MLHWTIWGRQLGVREGDIKVNLSITLVYFLLTLVIDTCKYSKLTQLMYHFTSYSSCSNWRPPTSMQVWHRHTRFCRTLTNIPGVFWILASQTPDSLPKIVQWSIPYVLFDFCMLLLNQPVCVVKFCTWVQGPIYREPISLNLLGALEIFMLQCHHHLINLLFFYL